MRTRTTDNNDTCAGRLWRTRNYHTYRRIVDVHVMERSSTGWKIITIYSRAPPSRQAGPKSRLIILVLGRRSRRNGKSDWRPHPLPVVAALSIDRKRVIPETRKAGERPGTPKMSTVIGGNYDFHPKRRSAQNSGKRWFDDQSNGFQDQPNTRDDCASNVYFPKQNVSRVRVRTRTYPLLLPSSKYRAQLIVVVTRPFALYIGRLGSHSNVIVTYFNVV